MNSPRGEDQTHRSIVSYVRRSPRMTPSQHRWWQTHSPQWVLQVTSTPRITLIGPQAHLDLEFVFGRGAPLIIEIGCGHGETLIRAAQAHPEVNFLGFEVFEASLATTLGKIASHNLNNIRLICGDAVTGLTHLIPNHAAEEIWVFFPDPWPKARHHKRRLINHDFVDLTKAKLDSTGTLRIATDWENYARSIKETFTGVSGFELVGTTRFALRPLTKFESRGIAAGRAIVDLTYQKSPS
ncbi:MAG: tRNA (guanosine(46)-N7)-methyltransferase TrmB [Propionibacteriaceae bacterium]|nr:tRNA (guanosine(46)-N7)-methyltransferase TrmB [Propionibacteriaceae bacterium]